MFLAVSALPADAEVSDLIWTSANASVAAVDSSGKVTAVSGGTTTVTVSCGDVSASCAVSVTADPVNPYTVSGITVSDTTGNALAAIPKGRFLATVSLTKNAPESDAMMLLASYDADGRYLGLLYVQTEDVPTGATFRLTVPVDNSDGSVAVLKAFLIASFANPAPLAAAVSFPA